MSEHFAIPATTFVLKGLIEARLKLAWGALNAPPVVTGPPPRPQPPAAGTQAPDEPTSVVLFCHHAGPNPAWRNMYEPHIDSSGKRVAKAPLVLDLHYMLAVTGASLEREAAFGVAIAALTRNAVVPRGLVQSILAAIAVPAQPATFLDLLTGEPLHDKASQPEQITLSQQQVDVDLSTKLWSALQSPLRPSAFFLATTVFLDPAEVFAPGQPVARTDVGVGPRTDRDGARDHAVWPPEVGP